MATEVLGNSKPCATPGLELDINRHWLGKCPETVIIDLFGMGVEVKPRIEV
jgi:hypothetical protein